MLFGFKAVSYLSFKHYNGLSDYWINISIDGMSYLFSISNLINYVALLIIECKHSQYYHQKHMLTERYGQEVGITNMMHVQCK
jgi:hypothetical protein